MLIMNCDTFSVIETFDLYDMSAFPNGIVSVAGRQIVEIPLKGFFPLVMISWAE